MSEGLRGVPAGAWWGSTSRQTSNQLLPGTDLQEQRSSLVVCSAQMGISRSSAHKASGLPATPPRPRTLWSLPSQAPPPRLHVVGGGAGAA